MSTQSMLALLDSDPAAGLRAAADDLCEEASRVSLGEGSFTGLTADDSARLVEWMLATVHHWRGVAERHTKDPAGDCLCCGYDSCWPCPDLVEVVDEARDYLRSTS